MSGVTSSRDRMLQAAISVIETDGEAAVRVDRIAAIAEVAKPSLYHFFTNRDGLIIAAQAERYRRSLAASFAGMAEPVRACRSREEFAMLLRNRIRSFSLPEGARRRRERIQVLGSAVSRPALRAEIAAVEEQTVVEFADMIRFAKSKGWVDITHDIEVTTRWAIGMILGRHLADDVLDEGKSDEWNDLTITAFEHILYSTPPLG